MAVDGDTTLEHVDVDQPAWSVSRLNDEIAVILKSAAERFPRYVVGEVSDATAKSYGTFLTLPDVDGGETIQCIVWSSYRDRIDESITEVGGVIAGSLSPKMG